MKRILALVSMILAVLFMSSHTVSAEENTYDRIYMITVDRFLNNNTSNDIGVTEDGDPFYPYGGDFDGIVPYLEYIKDMGFNTIMLSPVTERGEDDYLGYDVTDYGSISEAYGSPEDFEKLLAEAHELELKVIVDMPAVATDDYTALETPAFNNIQEEYYEDIGREIIDLNDAGNQETYRAMVQEFTNTYDVDGISMFVNQDGLNAEEFLPENIDTYGILSTEELTAEGFDTIAREGFRADLAQTYGGIDQEIPEFPEDEQLIMADHWFSERFTHSAAEQNMFPGTRIQQLANYLYAYRGPSAMTYGTEVAFNGSSYPEVHPQMDFRSDKEVIEYLENIAVVYRNHEIMLAPESETETILNEDGQYLVKYYTADVDYILNVNNTAETKSNTIEQTAEEEGKVLSGMLIGDMIRPHDGEYITVLDREETELYSIIEEAGFNNGYLYAAVLIFGIFAVFVWVAASRSRKNKAKRMKDRE
ncbi:alpha-amylase family glycosyl hydrolase [Jeotgalicoccus halotolerans]|uniref:Alpha amylase catalytic subunit n=1 Tax=Jeotgalicoccus halotolerans TaxID=157227 RepID=A0A3E0ARI9_9STAP|nr:alpha-amylase family glycosyl hydrolase [Jeotgalicoccus halotolerans]REG20795.1 alpha amylase catalytic subunit [Jeotgalicoccus halotolerans]